MKNLLKCFVKQRKKINTLELKLSTLEETMKSELWKNVLKKISEDEENKRLKEQIKRLKEQNKELKVLVCEKEK